MQLRRTQDQAMFIGCADADNACVICDLPATGIGDPNAGRARQNLRDGEGEGEADADDYLVCIHLPFIKADESLGPQSELFTPWDDGRCPAEERGVVMGAESVGDIVRLVGMEMRR